jgi:long-chain acyl-CoA synthetase
VTPDTLPRLLLHNAAERGGAPAIRHKRLGLWKTWSWSEQARQVSRLAFGLASRGFGAGQRLAVFADNRPETYWSFCAGQALGGVPVPLPTDLAADELAARLRAAQVTLAVAEGQEEVDKLLAARESVPELRAIVYVNGRELRRYGGSANVSSLEAALADGERLREASPGLVEEAIAAGRAGDAAVVLHTAGAGGVPRPVTLTHAELVGAAGGTTALFHLSPEDRVFAILATSWFVDHQTSYVQSYRVGYCVHCPEARDTILADLREVAPTYLAMSPRLVEALLRVVDARMATSARWRRRLLRWACERDTWLGRNLVIRPLVDGLGLPRLRVAVTVGRPVDRSLARRWRSLGLPLVEAHGCTEAGGLTALVTEEGALGAVAPGLELRSVDGELAFRRVAAGGPPEGDWKATGDVVIPTGSGAALVCRRDELFDGRAGKIAPSVLEARLTAMRGVRDALVVRDGEGGAAALVVPDPELLAAWAAEREIPYSTPADLARNEELVQDFAARVARLNDELGRDGLAGWAVGAFRLAFAPFDPDDLCPSGRPRRRRLEARHADLLASAPARDSAA